MLDKRETFCSERNEKENMKHDYLCLLTEWSPFHRENLYPQNYLILNTQLFCDPYISQLDVIAHCKNKLYSPEKVLSTTRRFNNQ